MNKLESTIAHGAHAQVRPNLLSAEPDHSTWTPQQLLAVMARILWDEGYADHHYGHITSRIGQDRLLATPHGPTWGEVTASDIIVIDDDAQVIEGRWPVTPAIELHVALHRQRPHVGVAIHHHPRYATIYAAAHRVPAAFDQTSAMVPDEEITLYDDFAADVRSPEAALANVRALGDSNYALLANHGALIVADNIIQATNRAVRFEWRCNLAWHVDSIGGGTPMSPSGTEAMVAVARRNRDVSPGLFEECARRVLRRDPSVLS